MSRTVRRTLGGVTHRTVVDALDAIGQHGVVAGGAARYVQHKDAPVPDDVDLFIFNATPGMAQVVAERLRGKGYGVTSEKGVLTAAHPGWLHTPIQIVPHPGKNVYEVFRTFGFVVEEFAVAAPRSPDEGYTFYYTDEAVDDLHARKLRLASMHGHLLLSENMRNPARTIQRIAKYGAKGFTIDAPQALVLLDGYMNLSNEHREKLHRIDGGTYFGFEETAAF